MSDAPESVSNVAGGADGRRRPQSPEHIAARAATFALSIATRPDGVPHKTRGTTQSAEHKAARAAAVAATLAKAPVPCAHCSAQFFRTIATQKYCSGMCWNALARRKRDRSHKIVVSPAAYKTLAARFGEFCNICTQPQRAAQGRGVGRLAVDHCHETGEVRGLLCHSCNTAIGLMKDDTARLELAIEYLTRARRAIAA